MESWTVQDKYNNRIYLTSERWQHIQERHDELIGRLDDVLDTLRYGQRIQEAIFIRGGNIMETDWLIEKTIMVNNQPIIYSYDKEADILEIIFQKGGGLGVDLTDNIVLRYNQDNQPLSLIFTDVTLLNRPTQFGPPSFQLTSLMQLPQPMQQTVLQILHSAPVNQVLKLSGLFQLPNSPQPITYLNQPTTCGNDFDTRLVCVKMRLSKL